MKLHHIVASVLLLWLSAGALAQQDDDLSQAQLDQMLAPIALYPDSVLSHVLIAATYPLEVVMAERWTRHNPNLKGQDAVEAVEDRDWDPSVKALTAFPDILQRMSEDLNWTERLGEAFLVDEERVLDSVQHLRQQAYDEGTLNDLEHLNVSRDTKRHIVIEPVVREVVYVPYYDSRVVYGSWWWSDYPPVYWGAHYHRDHGHWNWGPRVRISSGFYFSAFRWDHRRVVVIDRHHYHRNLWRARQIARHQNATHWRHDPYHRRGANYRNPRTRDYFEARRRESGTAIQNRRSVRSEQRQQEVRRELGNGRVLRQSERREAIRQSGGRARPQAEVRQRSELGSAKREALRPAQPSSNVQRAPRPRVQTQPRIERRASEAKRESRVRSSPQSSRGSSVRSNSSNNARGLGSARSGRGERATRSQQRQR